MSLVQDNKTKFYYDYVIFLLLHTWACRLLAKDPTSDMAKAFLRNQLGSCHELLRTCLRRLIHQGVAGQLGREIENLASVVNAFVNCLVPVPVDRETNSLVRRARDAFQQILVNNNTSGDPFLMDNIHLGTYNLVGQKIQVLIGHMRDWQLVHHVTDDYRWEFLQATFVWPSTTTASASSDRSNSNTLAAQDRRLIKHFQISCKKKVKQVRGLTDREMCSNCFVLENTLLENQEEEESEGGGGGGNNNNNGGGLI